MLKIGTIPVVDESFVRAVKYALDQIGINPDRLPQKKRRTALDGVSYANEDIYQNYFKVVVKERGEKNISKVRIIDGGDPTNTFCGETDIGFVSAQDFEVSGTGYITLRVVVEEDAIYSKFDFSSFLPEPKEPVTVIAEIISISGQQKVVQRWTGGMIHWRDRFIIPFGR